MGGEKCQKTVSDNGWNFRKCDRPLATGHKMCAPHVAGEKRADLAAAKRLERRRQRGFEDSNAKEALRQEGRREVIEAVLKSLAQGPGTWEHVTLERLFRERGWLTGEGRR